MSKQYDATKVGQQAETLGGVHSAAGLAKLYANIGVGAPVPAGSTAYASDLGPSMYTGTGWMAVGGGVVGVAGAANDGVTDDSAVFSAALAAIGSNQASLQITGPMLIGSPVTIPSNVQLNFIGKGALKPGAGITITFNGSYLAGPYKVFDLSNASSLITGTFWPVMGRVLTEHWGAVGDAVTDDSTAFNRCAKAAATAFCVGIQLLGKNYSIAATVYADGNGGVGTTTSPSWYGVNYFKTFVTGVGITSQAGVFQFTGGSGTLANASVNDIFFQGAITMCGIDIQGKNGIDIVNCRFELFFSCVRMYNNLSGTFTEFCRLRRCTLQSNNTQGLEFKVGSGMPSFHKSGIDQSSIVRSSGSPAILVGAGSFVYESPLDCIFQASADATMIRNNSTLPVVFQGYVANESSGGAIPTLADTHTVYFAGNVTTNGQSLLAGFFVRCQSVTINSDGSVTPLGWQKGFQTAIVPGANPLSSANRSISREYFIEFRAVNGYLCQYKVTAFVQGGGSAGVAQVVSTGLETNTGGYGTVTSTALTFSVNTSGDIVATNATWPASGVTATYQEFGLPAGKAGFYTQF